MAGRKAQAKAVDHESRFAADQLAEIAADFKARFPDDWEALRLCPLQHGLDTMIEKLNG